MSDDESYPNPPKVFISYSHDDKDHKAWVAKLATRLREKGVDVILDQWDTEPGDDMAKFMESGVRDADRVLMICTEKYVRKVDDGKGGAGYEAMIVSAELIADQGVRKFVPVVRQTAKKRVVPTALGTRKYIDLSEDIEDPDEPFPALRFLQQLGYGYLGPEDVTVERKGKLGRVLLEDILARQLRRLNRITFAGREVAFSEENFAKAIVPL